MLSLLNVIGVTTDWNDLSNNSIEIEHTESVHHLLEIMWIQLTFKAEPRYNYFRASFLLLVDYIIY